MLKGAMHVHSTYSDGEFTLDELREIHTADGCSFVCMNDHAEYFDNKSVQQYAQELRARSDDHFCFVMGLEYECERRMHILGYGATMVADTKDPQAVIRHIRAQRATAVIAHPKDEFFSWIQEFETLPDGIEGWNSKYDGRYAPRPGTFALIQELRKREPNLKAFYGQDLHWEHQFRGLHVLMDCDALTPGPILGAIAAGKFRGSKEELEMPSSGVLPTELLEQFGRVHARADRRWQFFKSGKAALDRMGIRVPERLKSQLRRIF
ncbi:MAG TPA: hypothetical protein VGS27_01845 [Candidatus Sulfotelmatobacter sp.]|nr:hypothetical protein [Candidatus Sulfotelmatobacter sp.]